MAFSTVALVLAIAGFAAAQLTGRGFPDCSQGPLKNNKVCDLSLDPLTRATALISAFTTDEKLNNTGHVSPAVPRLGLPAYTWWYVLIFARVEGITDVLHQARSTAWCR